MTSKIIVSIAALALAACGGRTIVDEQIREVPTPVPVYPAEAKDVPAPVRPLGARPADPGQGSDMLLAKVCEHVEFAIAAWPVLWAATGQPAPSLEVDPACQDPSE